MCGRRADEYLLSVTKAAQPTHSSDDSHACSSDGSFLRKSWPELLESIAALQPAHAVLLCNDKAYRGYEDFEATVQSALGDVYDVTAINHGREILGREPARRDPWYDPPRVLHARRR